MTNLSDNKQMGMNRIYSIATKVLAREYAYINSNNVSKDWSQLLLVATTVQDFLHT